MTQTLDDILFSQLAAAGENRSINPSDVAKAFDPEAWRRRLPQIRGHILGLARQGKLVILRKGKPFDPAQPLKGIYRVRALSAEELQNGIQFAPRAASLEDFDDDDLGEN